MQFNIENECKHLAWLCREMDFGGRRTGRDIMYTGGYTANTADWGLSVFFQVFLEF